MEAKRISLELIRPWRDQPRLSKGPTEGSYEEEALVRSIREQGVLQPIIVRPIPEDEEGHQYEVVAGERRYRAAKKLGLKEIPAVVRELSDEEAYLVALDENTARARMSDMELLIAAVRVLSYVWKLDEKTVQSRLKSRFYSQYWNPAWGPKPDGVLTRYGLSRVATVIRADRGGLGFLLELPLKRLELLAPAELPTTPRARREWAKRVLTLPEEAWERLEKARRDRALWEVVLKDVLRRVQVVAPEGGNQGRPALSKSLEKAIRRIEEALARSSELSKEDWGALKELWERLGKALKKGGKEGQSS